MPIKDIFNLVTFYLVDKRIPNKIQDSWLKGNDQMFCAGCLYSNNTRQAYYDTD
jgi:hypothetical protein